MPISRRDFLAGSLTSSALITSCGVNKGSDEKSAQATDIRFRFDQGVASGDPLQDSLVLWTRVSPATAKAQGALAQVTWQVAKDEAFENLVNQDQAKVGPEQNYCLKVDVRGLAADSRYFYRFLVDNGNTQLASTVGKTKTLAAGDVDSVNMAVFSCSNYPAGYFHAYTEAVKQGNFDVALHLGDYIYEYGRQGYAGEQAKELGREVNPPGELYSLDDYRTRYAQYRSDKHLQSIHAELPFIVVWDDHEIANDAYQSGAENHSEDEGDFSKRRADAIQAYFEWMPIRPLVPDETGKIYRQFQFGNLVNLLMLDTRIIGRDRQLEYKDYQSAETGQFNAEAFTQDLTSDQRTLLGEAQKAWLLQSISASQAVWQVLGQQVLMQKMLLPAVTLLPDPAKPELTSVEFGEIAYAYQFYQTVLEKGVPDADDALASAGMTPEQIAIVRDPTKKAYLSSPRIPYNLDAWDGYVYDRELILGTALASGKKLISLAGDTHNAWAGLIKTQDGKVAAAEFATPGVSSPGLETYLQLKSDDEARALEKGLTQLVDGLEYCNLSHRGFMALRFKKDKIETRWTFVSSVKNAGYEVIEALNTQLELDGSSMALTKSS